MDNLFVLDHPVARDLLTRLREANTEAEEYRFLSKRLSYLLAVEATRFLPTEPVVIETPLEKTEGGRLRARVAIVPILRAGLGMVDAFSALLPAASIGYIGLERDEETAQAGQYYCKLPDMEGTHAFVVDPMLATGGSASRALSILAQQGCASRTYVAVVAAPEGVERLQRDHPGVRIITAAVDRKLNGRKYILPGLGDFGDRLCGT